MTRRRASADRNEQRRRNRRGQLPRKCEDCGAAINGGVEGAVRCWDCLEVRNRTRRRL